MNVDILQSLTKYFGYTILLDFFLFVSYSFPFGKLLHVWINHVFSRDETADFDKMYLIFGEKIVYMFSDFCLPDVS